METEYGIVTHMAETNDGSTIYVYGIDKEKGLVSAAFLDGRPYVSLIRVTKKGREYFMKGHYRVYMDELEEVFVG